MNTNTQSLCESSISIQDPVLLALALVVYATYLILDSLPQTLPCAGLALVSDGVAIHAALSQLALLGREPPRLGRIIRQHKERDESDDKRHL